MKILDHGFSILRNDDVGATRGWVLVTVTVASLGIIMIIIWALAGDTISHVLQQAIDRVGF